MTAAINRRIYLKTREEQRMLSWQTRILAGYIAGGYQIEGENKALETAIDLAYDEIESAQIEEAKIERAQAPEEPRIGSYEKLLSGFGAV